jgi:arylsulfatase A-like enzyme
LRADHTGPYGGHGVSTPAIDSLAKDGVVFDRVYTNSSWTRPSIATILTSLHASSHSVMYKTDLLPDTVETVAEVMKAGGYRTAGFVTNINVAPAFHFDQGFDSYRYLAPAFFFGATDSGSKLSLYSGMRLIRERFISRKKYVENYYQDAQTLDRNALPWFDKHASEPFFTLIHYMDPHDPYFRLPYNGDAVARVDTPNPDPSRAEELRRLYSSNIEYMDEFMAKMIGQLKALHVYDETVIVFTADHGEEFQEHGGWWHGTTLYDEELHVPLIVKLSKNARAGTRSNALAGSIDVMPTLLAAAGLTCPRACQGRDLFGPAPAPAAVFAEEDHEGNVLRSIRSDQWKLILANPGNPRGLQQAELYDVVNDPRERSNLAAAQPERVQAMTRDLDVLEQGTRARAVTGEAGKLDDASKERLRALGYIQ